MPSYNTNTLDLNAPENLDDDGFLKAHLHKHIILGCTFPYSGLISDASRTNRLFIDHFCYKLGMDLQTVSIFNTLLMIARSELSLKIKVNLYNDPDEIPLMHQCFMNVHHNTFSKFLAPLVTEVASATQRGKVSEASFEDKYFLYVRGRKHNKTTFYLNFNKLIELGKALGFVSYNISVNKTNKGLKTQLNGGNL